MNVNLIISEKYLSHIGVEKQYDRLARIWQTRQTWQDSRKSRSNNKLDMFNAPDK